MLRAKYNKICYSNDKNDQDTPGSIIVTWFPCGIVTHDIKIGHDKFLLIVPMGHNEVEAYSVNNGVGKVGYSRRRQQFWEIY
jgi:hypothetical protein